MADSRAIKWIDGEVLCGKKLEESGNLFRKYVYSLISRSTNYSSGIWRLKINSLALQGKKLQIDNLGCVFPDGTLVDEDYSLAEKSPVTLDLSGYAKEMSRGKIFYLIHHHREESHITLGSPIDPTMVTLVSPAVKIVAEPGENAVPFAKMVVNPLGQLEIDHNFSGSLLKINKDNGIFKDLNELLSKVRSMSLLIQRQLEESKSPENLLRFRSWNMVGCYLGNLLNELSPWIMHRDLLLVCGELSWIVGKTVSLGAYEHSNSLASIHKMVNFIQGVLNNKQVIILDPVIEKDHLYFDLKNYDYRAIYIAVQPVSPEAEKWIENANIGSRSSFNNLLVRRFIGIEREISHQSSQGVWLKLNLESKYFVAKENLMISLPKDNLFNHHQMSCRMLIE
jgi:predicted component of type VI protein secretion system